MYKLIRPLLFLLDPEVSHRLALRSLSLLYRVPGGASVFRTCLAHRIPRLPVEAMGLRFPHPVGLAAGFDKNAECVRPLAGMGFACLELGTVTPRPQAGNPKKRLYRLTKQDAIVNRMGFNSAGLNTFVANLRRASAGAIIGVNLGKNADTPIAHALDDYITGMRIAYSVADYITINVSSPNTKDLRELQEAENLNELLHALKSEQSALARSHGRYVPIALKIAPDLSSDQIERIADQVLRYSVDAVIATNTSTTRPGLDNVPQAREPGGLSGRPLKDLSTKIIGEFYARLQGRVPIIGVGGISSAEDAWEKLVAGADLIQIYSAFIFAGPGVVYRIVSGLAKKTSALGCDTLANAVAKARKNN